MLLSYKSTADSRLFRMRRLAVRLSKRQSQGGSEMAFTASGSPPSGILIFNHHQIGGPIGIIGCRQTYERSSVTSEAMSSTPVGDRGSNRIGSSNRIRLGTRWFRWYTCCGRQTGKKSILNFFTRIVKTLICML